MTDLAAPAARDFERELHEFCGEHYADPLAWVRGAFPWGEDGPLSAYREPDTWQCEFLEWLGSEITARRFDGIKPVMPIKGAISSGHGIGKGALVGMLVAFLMSTRRNAKGVITANTSTQLQDKTWAGIQTWVKRAITKHWFELNTSIMYRRGNRAEWKCSPQTCDPDNSEAFAGQHNVASTSFYIFDEACLREDTDILTRRGWVRVSELTACDDCLTMHPETGIAEYQPIVGLHLARRSGPMLECVGRNAGWSVTPTHKMWARKRRPRTNTYGPWRFVEARHLTSADNMTRMIQWPAADVASFTIPAFTSARKYYSARAVPMDAWVQFMGWYFSEGHVTRRVSAQGQLEHIAIGITNRRIEPAVDAATRCGLSVKVYRGRVADLRCHDRALAEYLGQFGHSCLTRRLPDFLRTLSVRQINLFLDAYVAGDGYHKSRGLDILYTSSSFLADGLHELCVRAGWSSRLTVRKLKGRVSDLGTHTATSTTDGYVISRSAQQTHLSVQKASRVQEVSYKGMVYCPELPKHHLLYTRRLGACVWVGNSNVPQSIFETAEGGLTDGEPMLFMFGNPTRRRGTFYDVVFGGEGKRWGLTRAIDARDCTFPNKALIAEQLEDWGEDSDRFRVRVRGVPPKAEDAQFIDSLRVIEAQKRQVVVFDDEPLIAGCDLAWGGKDSNVIRFRRGPDARSIPAIRIPGELTRDPSVLVNRLSDVLAGTYNGHRVAMLFLDSAGIAGSVGTRLRELGHTNLLEVNFGADSPDRKYRYMRDMMWGRMKEWLLKGAIDKSPRLEADLTAPGLREDLQQRVWLESKKDMRARDVPSPDEADSLCLTFAQTVAKVKKEAPVVMPQFHGLPQGWMG
jgi:hypothetical protein